MITTEAWVLYNLQQAGEPPKGLEHESFEFGELGPSEVLVEPLYGCWEGNMGHAVERKPIDIAYQRGEKRVVIGNAGVVRVLQRGADVATLAEGDLCVLCASVWDKHGFMDKALGYDAPGTLGLLAKRTKVCEDQLVRIPHDTRFHLSQWASFSVRYITAWTNWNVAVQCWNAMRPRTPGFEPCVWGWGGGTTFAEVSLAQKAGFRTALISGVPERLRLIAAAGITPIDRSQFKDLHYDDARIDRDRAYRATYREAEDCFLHTVKQHTGGHGASIFVDQIGASVLPATLKALGRPGIITTSGWKSGLKTSFNRAVACMNWHTHVHTHYARLEDCEAAVLYAEENGWLPELPDYIYEWEEVPRLAGDYQAGKLDTYFPIYRINPE